MLALPRLNEYTHTISNRYCLACAGTFDSRECFEAHVTQSDDCFQMMQGGRGGAGGAPPGGWAPAQEEVDLDFDD